MKARFVGELDFAAQNPAKPHVWELAADFGFLRDDGLLIVALAGGHTDGASIPRFLWRIFGHPFMGTNRFWAIPHDAGYSGPSGYAIIIDLNAAQLPPDYALDNWMEIGVESLINSRNLSRKWWDQTLLMAMSAMGEGWFKRRAVYRAVRLFGWRSYRKNRR